jgi:DNA primase
VVSGEGRSLPTSQFCDLEDGGVPMTNWVDFKAVREQVSLEQVLFDFYKIDNLTIRDGKAIGPCPVHGGDSPRAFSADFQKNAWFCFSRCKRGGNQLDFVALKEDISIRDAALLLKDHFELEGAQHDPPAAPRPRKGSETNATRARATQRCMPKPRNEPASEVLNGSAPAPCNETSSTTTAKRVERPLGRPEANPPLAISLTLKPYHPHLTEVRGLAESTLDQFGIGYANKGIMRGCIAIPIHNGEGDLVAYAGRRLKPQLIREHGKYKFPKGFHKSVELYNLHRAREHLTRGLILVEGFFGAIHVSEAGFPNVVAAMGSELSPWQAELLAEAPEVLILFDGDEAGRSGGRAARELLDKYTTVRLVALPKDKSPDDISPRALRWLINGMQQLELAQVSFES